ncbi:MAG: DNA internalization-related competence protein ComEC/Rec2 [Casimicrobiaceae bacterium]
MAVPRSIHRPPIYATLTGFACGVTLVQFMAALPQAGALAIGGVLALSASWRMPFRALRVIGWFCAMLLLGATFSTMRASARMVESLNHALEGVDIAVTGVVAGLPSVSEAGTRFVFDVERVEPATVTLPPRISLSWFVHVPEPQSSPASRVHAGERWHLQVRLKRPHSTLNFAGFDAEAWLFERDLRAVGHVHDGSSNVRIEAFVMRPATLVERAREALRTRILSALERRPYAGVIVALTIGDQQAVPDSQWRVFSRTGISHLISISGLHITVFASVIGAVVLFLASFSTWLTSRLAARRLAVLVGAAAATGYTLLAGAEVPAQRTLVMLIVAAIGLWTARPAGAAIVWLWALVIVLIWDPWASIAAGFWLSFGAVGLLLYAGTNRVNPQSPRGTVVRAWEALREGTHAQWVVTLGLVPLTLALFQQVSLVAPLANAVAIPVVTFGIVSLALLGIVLPVDALFVGAHAVFAQLMRYLEWLAQWPDAAWQQHAPVTWTIACAMVGTLWLLAPRGLPGRSLGLVWMLPIFLVVPLPPAMGRFRLTVLDVGQGLSAVVQTRTHALLFDTGPRYGDNVDAGSRIVVPNLRAMGVTRLDTMLVSHADSDHSGGALSILDLVTVDRLRSSLPANHAIVARIGRMKANQCAAGQRWNWDGVTFSVLWPRADAYLDPLIKSNDMSCVLRIDGEYGSALLTGDIEAADEQSMLAAGAELHADVIVVPHHGSRTSSTRPFVEAVHAAVAVFTPGYRNRFGHPRPEVVARYRQDGALVLRSDADGGVELELDGTRSPPWRSARIERKRYWHDVMEVE